MVNDVPRAYFIAVATKDLFIELLEGARTTDPG